MVVISIIGLLASIVLASLNTARAKARDARRIEDLRQFQIALELCSGKLGPDKPYLINPETSITSFACERENFQDTEFLGVLPATGWAQKCSEFMQSPPKDPSGRMYIIHTSLDYKNYVLIAQLETTNAYTKSIAEITAFVEAHNIPTGAGNWDISGCSNFNYIIGN